jgi:hypothetical protein
MNQKSISARDLKTWQNASFTYRTTSHVEYGFRFYDIDIMDKNRMSSMTIRFQLDLSDTSLFNSYGAQITNLGLHRSNIFLPFIKHFLNVGYSESIRKVIKILNKNKIMRTVYNKECNSFVPYAYRNNAEAFLAAAKAISFSK